MVIMCLQSKGVWVYDHYIPAEMTLAYPHLTLLTMAPYGKSSLVPGTQRIFESTVGLGVYAMSTAPCIRLDLLASGWQLCIAPKYRHCHAWRAADVSHHRCSFYRS